LDFHSDYQLKKPLFSNAMFTGNGFKTNNKLERNLPR
jgi:hypothetical protein